MLRNISRMEFAAQITADPRDRFAKTFLSKCDMMGGWDEVVGVFSEAGELCGAVWLTVGKHRNANLQLLHVFARHRRKGYGEALCKEVYRRALAAGAVLFRVSAERDAVEFYRRIGFRFWGTQKSGTWLSLFRVSGSEIADGIYDLQDPLLSKALKRKGKGELTHWLNTEGIAK